MNLVEELKEIVLMYNALITLRRRKIILDDDYYIELMERLLDHTVDMINRRLIP